MRYQICVSGASTGETVRMSKDLAFELGRAVAESGKTLTTGATVGLPMHAAAGFKSFPNPKGLSVGFSPASSFREHVNSYKLPVRQFDYINFTGMDYVGRDVHLVRCSDAVITIGGKMGTLHELATALESGKVCGVLLGSGGTADYAQTLFGAIEVPEAKDVIYDTDPDELVWKVVARLDAEYEGFYHDPEDTHVSARRSGEG